MSNPFRSLATPKAAKVTPRQWSEAQVVDVAKQLLAEHVERRIEATKAANLVCGLCEGTGRTESTLMPGERVPCHACEGSGQPNEASIAVPEFTPADTECLWKIGQLLKGPHRLAVLRVVKEVYPELYPQEIDKVTA